MPFFLKWICKGCDIQVEGGVYYDTKIKVHPFLFFSMSPSTKKETILF